MSDESLRRLLTLRHGDPHGVLGPHPVAGGQLLRVFRPDALKVTALRAGKRFPLAPRTGFDGIFEALTPPGERYRLEVDYGPGRVFTVDDPYAFGPTVGAQDLHFAGEGRHERLWEVLGAHPRTHQGVDGTSFAVWAPNAESISVVGDFNRWDSRIHLMRCLGSSGIWEIFVPGVGDGERYKFELRVRGQPDPFHKADPMAFGTEVPPRTASVIHDSRRYAWGDARWLTARKDRHAPSQPMSIYEVHPTSWRRVPEEGNRPLTWRELGPALASYVKAQGFTHVELLPIAEHPYGGSWGYQVTSYFAPTARLGTPDDFRFFIDTLHQAGIGVLVDWVPGHFPRDAWALARFDGTALYEHEDPRKGAHPDWGTLIFNFGRNEVRNFLVANALFWLETFHVDGLRVDAVASMLYLDYSRKHGEWEPNVHGGRENLEAIAFLRELNDTVQRRVPGALVIAEESTAWPKVSRPVADGGLGFTHKWNMGWMHDTLKYFQTDPIYRRHHHHQLTFGLIYAFTENFVLPLSHDEVVHGKGALINKLPGDDWQRFATLRALYAWMFAHPGKKLLFMGGELAQWKEWNHDHSLDWHLLELSPHQGVQRLVAQLNRALADYPALRELDFTPDGFQWMQADAADYNVYAFVRQGTAATARVLCVANLSPVVRTGYRVGVPLPGRWHEVLSTDARDLGGTGIHSAEAQTESVAWDGQAQSLVLTLPPLAVVYFAPG
ncbi:MAG: 1,4-alpha-glucan branching protein GlgB [Myxococcaceae bacterium]|nr:1,4-alpha-glucan branching protein GlgB [Myxococcaceae bacterium]